MELFLCDKTNQNLLYLTQRQLSPLLALGLSQESFMSSDESRIHSYASEIVLDPIGFCTPCRTRTYTRRLDPKSSASTNSAKGAFVRLLGLEPRTRRL